MLKISPTRSPEYFEKLPPLESITRPRAVESEANTEITVSFEMTFFLFMGYLFR